MVCQPALSWRAQRSEQPQSRHVQRNAGMPSHAGGVETGA